MGERKWLKVKYIPEPMDGIGVDMRFPGYPEIPEIRFGLGVKEARELIRAIQVALKKRKPTPPPGGEHGG